MLPTANTVLSVQKFCISMRNQFNLKPDVHIRLLELFTPSIMSELSTIIKASTVLQSGFFNVFFFIISFFPFR